MRNFIQWSEYGGNFFSKYIKLPHRENKKF